MYLNLYNNLSEDNEINKNISTVLELEGTLKEKTSITDPIILIEENTIFAGDCNYAYIPDFGRYYFITDIRCVRANLYEIVMHVDVLMSFKNDILDSYAIIENTSYTDTTLYLPDDSWRVLVKDKTDIINFSNGLSESGHYILITAGG